MDRALAERITILRAEGAVPADVDVDALLAEARRELLDLGPLAALFHDEDVSEIQIVRSDYVVAMHGRRQVPSEIGFSSEAAVARVIRRSLRLRGQAAPARRAVRRAAALRGARMFAVLPPASDRGHMVVIRKPQRADLTLEDLVRSGTISRAMAGLFAQCVEARANLLVTGAVGAGATRCSARSRQRAAPTIASSCSRKTTSSSSTSRTPSRSCSARRPKRAPAPCRPPRGSARIAW